MGNVRIHSLILYQLKKVLPCMHNVIVTLVESPRTAARVGQASSRLPHLLSKPSIVTRVSKWASGHYRPKLFTQDFPQALCISTPLKVPIVHKNGHSTCSRVTMTKSTVQEVYTQLSQNQKRWATVYNDHESDDPWMVRCLQALRGEGGIQTLFT